ncbi:hypothetical protein BGZ98_001100 [Dissophora globulifera]|nr:hypothetical protein BGZ98_001100 [Dissophora globulifera]
MDPRKLKVNELKEQLQLVGLSVNGKKEELVARLLEHQKAEEEAVNAGGLPTGTVDNYDWDESKFDVDDLAPPSDPVTSSSKTTAPAPVQKSTTAAAPSPSTVSSTLTSNQEPTASNTTSTAAPAVSATASTGSTSGASTGTATTGSVQFQGAVKDAETLKAEFEKRKNRAARFGIPLKEQDKAVERAARFGVPVPASVTASLAKATGVPAAATSGKPQTLPTKPGSVTIPEDVLNKRRERFGVQAPASSSTVSPAKSSGIVLDAAEEEKKRKRAAKFGASSAAEDSSKKLKA